MATVKDIAQEAGVSIGTVDRVLHNRGRFSEQTACKVRDAMKRLGYRKNVMARNLSQSRTCRIAAIMPFPEIDSGYWALAEKGIREAAGSLEAFKVECVFFFFDRYLPGSFTEAVNRCLKKKWDGFLVTPLLRDEYLPLEEKLKGPEGNRPVCFFDTDLSEAHRTAFIGQDSFQGGVLGAKLMGLLLGGTTGKILILQPDTENDHLIQRIKGFTDCWAGKCRTCRVDLESPGGRFLYEKKMKEALTEGLQGIFVVDASAHYTAEFFQRHPVQSRVPLIGFDLVPENRKQVEQRAIDFIVTQRPIEQGALGMELLYRAILLGEKEPGDRFMPLDIITLENLP